MTRRTWVYIDGVAYERGVDAVPEVAPLLDSGALWGDSSYVNTRGPNGEDLSTRTKHREFLKQTGLATMDDFSESWKRSTEKRAEYFRDGKHGAVRREHIDRAINQLQNKR